MKLRICLLLCLYVLNARSQSVSLNFQTGYHTEDFSWSIAGNAAGSNPNVLSELIWKNIKGISTGLDVEVNLWSSVLLKTNYHRTFLRSGRATDTDYGSDNRMNPTYHTEVKSNEGYTYRYSAALGYTLILSPNIQSVPYAGYMRNAQSLSLNALNEMEQGSGLNSKYATTWSGALIGLDTRISLGPLFSVSINAGYQQLNYVGKANWNLIDAFAHPLSFMHKAKGYELSGDLHTYLKVSKGVYVFLKGRYSYAETGKGTDELFLANGNQTMSQFNGAIRKSKDVALGLSLHF